jgi:uncharacterized protein YndB with AHSA1/START domain
MISTQHDTVRSRIMLAASPERVFAAWADADQFERWYVPGDEDWVAHVIAHEFRVGGVKKLAFGRPGESYLEDCRYEDIVENARICYAMTISRGETRITTSMVTMELFAHGGETECVVTDQLVLLDGGDTAADRERGWGEALAKLPTVLAS